MLNIKFKKIKIYQYNLNFTSGPGVRMKYLKYLFVKSHTLTRDLNVKSVQA